MISQHTIEAAAVGGAIWHRVYETPLSETFDAPTVPSGWAAYETGAPLSVDGGHLLMESVSDTAQGGAVVTITGLTVGVEYTVAWSIARDVGSGFAYQVAAGAWTTVSLNPTTYTKYETTFTAGGTSTSFTIVVNGSSLTGRQYLDWLSVGAWVQEAGSLPLDVKSAEITLDEGWSPYCQATLVCSIPDSDLDLIDPREGTRVEFTITQKFTDDDGNPYNAAGTLPETSRSFDLTLRQRTVDHVAEEMTLVLSSDEALAQDYKLLSATPVVMGTTVVEDIVATVLAYIGAELV